jgi:hypothetical protein
VDVGAFETSSSIPPSIEVTTPLRSGTVIVRNGPFAVRWRNGTSDAFVELRLITHKKGDMHTYAQCAVVASEGEVTLMPALSPTGRPPFILGVLPGPAEVVLIVTPRTGAVQTFSAPGLTRESRHDWTYEYHFTGLEIL